MHEDGLIQHRALKTLSLFQKDIGLQSLRTLAPGVR